MTAELITWLRAQVDTDEAEAPHVHHGDCDNAIARGHDSCNCEWPARVLAEVESKRAILDQHPDDEEGFCGDRIGLIGCKWAHPCPTLRALALAYRDREGYREGWRP